MKRVLIIPLWFGDMFAKKDDTSSNVHRVCKYLKRSLFLFRTRENITVLYPKDPKKICDPYIHRFDADALLIHMQTIVMDRYVSVSRNDDPAKHLALDELTEQLKNFANSNMENVIIFVNSGHVPLLTTAFRNVFGFAEEMRFYFAEIGGTGNTDAFFFDKDDKNSVNHLRFSDYLDFFIPERLTELTPEIINLGAKAERVIQEHGRTKVLRSLADFVSVI